MSRMVWIGAAIFVLTGMAQQPAPMPALKPLERFTGRVKLQGGEEVNVTVHNWIIQSSQRIPSFDLPAKGTVIVQLRGGSLITTIAGKEQVRRPDEFWTVPAGATMGIETKDDAAVIQTIVVSR